MTLKLSETPLWHSWGTSTRPHTSLCSARVGWATRALEKVLSLVVASGGMCQKKQPRAPVLVLCPTECTFTQKSQAAPKQQYWSCFSHTVGASRGWKLQVGTAAPGDQGSRWLFKALFGTDVHHFLLLLYSTCVRCRRSHLAQVIGVPSTEEQELQDQERFIRWHLLPDSLRCTAVPLRTPGGPGFLRCDNGQVPKP